MKLKWGRVLGFSLNNNRIRIVDRYLIIPWRGNVEPINIYLCVLLILGMKTNVITPRNNRIISASHLSCSQPLLLLLSLCNVKNFGEAAAGAGAGAVHHCTTIWRGHTLNVAQPEASPSTRLCAHHQSRSTEYTTQSVASPHPGCPVSCRAEAGSESCVVLCGVMAAWR